MQARLIAEYLGRDLKQTVFVENKAGAQGAIGAEAVAHGEPDGYTLLFTAGSVIVMNPMLYKKLSYDPDRELRVLTIVTDLPIVVIVHPSVPAKTLAEFVAYAKQNPGKLNFGSAGTGGVGHLSGELFKGTTGIEMTHVPYKGAGPALQDLISGNIQALFETIGTALPPIKSGLVRALGVSSAERVADLPDLPTVVESGYPDYRVSVWYGIAAPAKVPEEIAQAISASMNRALNDEVFRASLTRIGFWPLRARRRGCHQGVHGCRQGAVVGCHQEVQHLAGLRRMVRENEVRDGELAIDLPPANDAGLVFIGRIRTPWTSRLATPRQGRLDGPVCRLEIFEPFVPAIKGVDFYSNLEVIYWLHESRRDLLLQSPKNNKNTRGTFSLRSPVRPNPIGTSIVKFVGIEGNTVLVRGLDCLDETPLLDIKPDRCEFTPLAPPQAGDFETE